MIKDIISLIKSKFLWLNILSAIIILIILGMLSLVFLKKHTRHGEFVVVPEFVGLYENEAVAAAKKASIIVEVADSTYDRNAKPGIIVEQTPKEGLKVKKGRKIFVTINSINKRKLSLPDVINASQRQATYTLKSMGFQIGDIDVVPSEYADLVLDIKYNGNSVKPGEQLPDGAKLSLTVGMNNASYEGEMVTVPSLIGKTLKEAENIILSNNLVVGYTGFDDPRPTDERDKELFLIYKQIPSVEENVIPGKRIDIWLTKDYKKLENTQETTKKEDDFF